MSLKFEKWSGAGNDFILVDLRNPQTAQSILASKRSPSEIARAVCRRTYSVGADGLIFLTSDPHGIAWDFYNADGSKAEMCGNAARCVGSYELRRSGESLVTVQTLSGPVVVKPAPGFSANGGGSVSVFLAPPVLKKESLSLGVPNGGVTNGVWIDSGVPHCVVALPEASKSAPPREFSRQLRTHAEFGDGGANVTYVFVQGSKVKAVTYERGVEDYTQACGTGALAAAFFLNHIERTPNASRVIVMPGGELMVSWIGPHVVLTGDAQRVCFGEFTQEAL